MEFCWKENGTAYLCAGGNIQERGKPKKKEGKRVTSLSRPERTGSSSQVCGLALDSIGNHSLRAIRKKGKDIDQGESRLVTVVVRMNSFINYILPH